jgi:hypothetical protein
MDDDLLAQWEQFTDRLLNESTQPWHVRHARKLIGGAIALAAVGVASFSFYAWRTHTEPVNLVRQPTVPTAPRPVTALPESPPAPPAVAAPDAPAASRVILPPRATVPERPAAPAVSTAAPAVQPAAVAPASRANPAAASRANPAAASRASPAVASRASPTVPPVVLPPTSPRGPAVTHTLRDEPVPKAAPAATATVALPAGAAPVAAPPAPAAPRDCSEAVIALGLCTSDARKGAR